MRKFNGNVWIYIWKEIKQIYFDNKLYLKQKLEGKIRMKRLVTGLLILTGTILAITQLSVDGDSTPQYQMQQSVRKVSMSSVSDGGKSIIDDIIEDLSYEVGYDNQEFVDFISKLELGSDYDLDSLIIESGLDYDEFKAEITNTLYEEYNNRIATNAVSEYKQARLSSILSGGAYVLGRKIYIDGKEINTSNKIELERDYNKCNIESVAKKGDIIVETDTTVGGLVGHAIIVEGTYNIDGINVVLGTESTSDGVVTGSILTCSRLSAKNSKLYRVKSSKATTTQKTAAYNWASNKEGYNYNYNFLTKSCSNSKFYCFQLLYCAYNGYVNLDSGKDTYIGKGRFGFWVGFRGVSPREISNSDNLDRIYF